MLCYVMLCYVMLCYVMLCYVILHYIIFKHHATAPKSFLISIPLRRNFLSDIAVHKRGFLN